jgi:hypothetical protein
MSIHLVIICVPRVCPLNPGVTTRPTLVLCLVGATSSARLALLSYCPVDPAPVAPGQYPTPAQLPHHAKIV